MLATAALAGRAPRQVLAVTIVRASLELGFGLSAVAAASLGDMVARGIEVLTDWGLLTVHEWGLVAEAVREVERGSHGAAVRSVTLRLGPGAAGVTVRTAWDQVTAGGPLSGAELVIVNDEHRMQCLGCEHEYLGQLPRPCPQCGGDGLVRTAAADLTVGAWVLADPRPESLKAR